MLVKSKIGGKGNSLLVPVADIHVMPGFNIRLDDDEREERILRYKSMLMAGNKPPPLLVKIDPNNMVWVIDGHMRLEAAKRALAEGYEIVTLEVIRHVGNDVDQVVAMITSGEARPWAPIELAEGYKRLLSFGLTELQIAVKVGRTVVHVRDIIHLACADHRVQKMVLDGEVSATTVISTIRAGEKDISGTMEKAKMIATNEGSAKVMPRHVDQARGRSHRPQGAASPQVIDELRTFRHGLCGGERHRRLYV